jgi:hypothetical protein
MTFVLRGPLYDFPNKNTLFLIHFEIKKKPRDLLKRLLALREAIGMSYQFRA